MNKEVIDLAGNEQHQQSQSNNSTVMIQSDISSIEINNNVTATIISQTIMPDVNATATTARQPSASDEDEEDDDGGDSFKDAINVEFGGQYGEEVVEPDHRDSDSTMGTPNSINLLPNRLTPELIMRAELEVNEKDEWRLRDIEALREIIINSEISLKSRIDDAFLLRFLRARRFDYDSAFRLICDYYRLRANNLELFQSLDKLKTIFECNVLSIGAGRSNSDEALFLLRLGKWNTRKFSFDDIISAAILSMEMVIQDEVTQINGVACVIDMAGFGWSQLKKFGPSQAKKVIHILDKCLPIRVKVIYIINESTLADIGFAIMKPFMSEELHEKILFCSSNLNLLHQHISTEYLPTEFGGFCGPMSSDEWYRQLSHFDPEFRHEFAEFGFRYNNNAGLDDPTAGGKRRSISDKGCTGTDSVGSICSGGIDDGGIGASRYSDSPFNSGSDMKSLFRKSQTCNGYLFDYYNSSTSVD